MIPVHRPSCCQCIIQIVVINMNMFPQRVGGGVGTGSPGIPHKNQPFEKLHHRVCCPPAVTAAAAVTFTVAVCSARCGDTYPHHPRRPPLLPRPRLPRFPARRSPRPNKVRHTQG